MKTLTVTVKVDDTETIPMSASGMSDLLYGISDGSVEGEVRVERKFSERNRLRCEVGFHHKLTDWTLSDWMTATAGELGEAANIIKKLNRYRDGIEGNTQTKHELELALAEELADIYIYLDLMVQAAGLDLETIREEKFQKTSRKIDYVE